MGYDLGIVRRKNWDDYAEPSNITLEEWLSYANNDPELKRNSKEGENHFDWIGYPEDHDMGVPWFDYYDGHITTKNPNIHVFRKLLSISKIFNAKVLGEEGEEYDESFLESIS